MFESIKQTFQELFTPEKEEEFIEYTIRLDLDEIRKKIDSNLK